MEGELFRSLYVMVHEEAKRHFQPKYTQYRDAVILLVYFWAAINDRPICWACKLKHWPEHMQWIALPSESTMSRRLKTCSCWHLLESVYQRQWEVKAPSFCVCRRIDTKPLVVGGFSKDRDARRGYATGNKARGYKAAVVWGRGLVPDKMLLSPLSRSDQSCAFKLIDLLKENAADATGYLLADSTHETNPVHSHAMKNGFQLVARRKKPGTGLGHGKHSPARLRCIELMESDAPNRFGRELYALRGDIERDFGHLCSFGGGLQSLPSWVRRPRRVTRWVIAKLIIRAIRICLIKGLAA
jgi:hypothetical protein